MLLSHGEWKLLDKNSPWTCFLYGTKFDDSRDGKLDIHFLGQNPYHQNRCREVIFRVLGSQVVLSGAWLSCSAILPPKDMVANNERPSG